MVQKSNSLVAVLDLELFERQESRIKTIIEKSREATSVGFKKFVYKAKIYVLVLVNRATSDLKNFLRSTSLVQELSRRDRRYLANNLSKPGNNPKAKAAALAKAIEFV